MPRIDRRRLRTGLRLGLPNDPISNRAYSNAIKLPLVGASVALAGAWFVPGVSRDDRLALIALLAALVACVVTLELTLARSNPRLAWCIVTVLEMATIAIGIFLFPGTYVAGLLIYAAVVARTTAIGGLGIGLVASLLATAGTVWGAFIATGDASELALTCGFAIIGYPTVALSVDGYSLSRHRATTQLARLHDALRLVSAEPSLSATLDSLVEVVQEAFGSASAAVLLRSGDHLKIAAPGVLPLPGWKDKVEQWTAVALQLDDGTPVARAMSRGETVVVRDIETETRFTNGGSAWRDRLRGLGLASLVVVPLRQGATPVGLFHVAFRRRGALADDELALLEGYAEQATIVITRAQAYAELEAANALKSEFLATVSHELRTPLTAAKGFVDTVLLQWDRLDDAQRRQLLERASANSDELARLIDQLLDYSRLDAGTVRVFPVDVELVELVGDVVARMAPVFDDHTVVIDADVPVTAHVDADAFAHVLGNLLTNAVNFSSDGSLIRVVVVRDPERACISVHDDGIGIAPEEHERIFERFYRIGADSGSGRGTGIGLAIAAGFVDLLEGTIGVESVPGAGSTFWFSVPIAGDSGRERRTGVALRRRRSPVQE